MRALSSVEVSNWATTRRIRVCNFMGARTGDGTWIGIHHVFSCFRVLGQLTLLVFSCFRVLGSMAGARLCFRVLGPSDPHSTQDPMQPTDSQSHQVNAVHTVRGHRLLSRWRSNPVARRSLRSSYLELLAAAALATRAALAALYISASAAHCACLVVGMTEGRYVGGDGLV